VLLDGHGSLDRCQQGRRHPPALCGDARTAEGARKWNDANVLALSLRATSEPELEEILDAWFAAGPSTEPDDVANVEHLADIR
jgi:ribose 5-phosphate isomerase B